MKTIHRPEFEIPSCELLWIQLSLPRNEGKLFWGVCYRPPSSNATFHDALNKSFVLITPHISSFKSIILCSGFHIHNLVPFELDCSRVPRLLPRVFHQFHKADSVDLQKTIECIPWNLFIDEESIDNTCELHTCVAGSNQRCIYQRK